MKNGLTDDTYGAVFPFRYCDFKKSSKERKQYRKKNRP